MAASALIYLYVDMYVGMAPHKTGDLLETQLNNIPLCTDTHIPTNVILQSKYQHDSKQM